MSQIGGWIDGGGSLWGEGFQALSRALSWNGIGWREAYCQRAFGLLALAERGSEPRPLYVPAESGNLILFWDGAVEGGGEAILRAYKKRHRASFADSLRGSFCMALLDEGRGELVLVRSRDGETPLYYAENEHRLVFSSQIKGITALLPDRARFKRERLLEWLETPPEERRSASLYETVREFPWGQTMVCSRFGRVMISHGQRSSLAKKAIRREAGTLPESILELSRTLYRDMMRHDAPIYQFPPCSVKERKHMEALLWKTLGEWEPFELNLLCGENYRQRIERERGEKRLDFMANLHQAMLLCHR